MTKLVNYLVEQGANMNYTSQDINSLNNIKYVSEAKQPSFLTKYIANNSFKTDLLSFDWRHKKMCFLIIYFSFFLDEWDNKTELSFFV